MKKLILGAALCLSLSSSWSQSEKFLAAMKTSLEALKTATTAEQMIEVESKFERIANAEKNQWLPFYYAALLKCRLSMQKQGGDPDKLADEASQLAEKADSLNPNNSEVYCLKSMVATAKMLVDPQNRWMQYGQESQLNLEKAKKLNDKNPRPFALQAMSTKNMPVQFGGGCEKAKPIAQKAQSLFSTFKPATEIDPIWGKDMIDNMLEECK